MWLTTARAARCSRVMGSGPDMIPTAGYARSGNLELADARCEEGATGHSVDTGRTEGEGLGVGCGTRRSPQEATRPSSNGPPRGPYRSPGADSNHAENRRKIV